jgi:hypothetical protein
MLKIDDLHLIEQWEQADDYTKSLIAEKQVIRFINISMAYAKRGLIMPEPQKILKEYEYEARLQRHEQRYTNKIIRRIAKNDPADNAKHRQERNAAITTRIEAAQEAKRKRES